MPDLVADTLSRLEARADPFRAAFGANYHPTAAQILGLSAPAIQEIARRLGAETRPWTAAELLALSHALIDSEVFEARQLAYLVISKHRATRACLDRPTLEALGAGLDNWVSVDTFGTLVSGEALRTGQIQLGDLLDWAGSSDRWWRRLALVSTLGWNQRGRGGHGEVEGTLAVCAALAADRDEMVVKALSWALRQLAPWDADAVRAFLDRTALAARVRREVDVKLRTGRKRG